MGRVENIVEKRENASYQHFLLFPQCFQKASYLYKVIKQIKLHVKVLIVWLKN